MKTLTMIFIALGLSGAMLAQTEQGEMQKPLKERNDARKAELIQELNLTEEQQQQWDAIKAKYKAEREQEREAREKERQEAREKVRESRTSQQAELEAILTPEQLEVMKAFRAKRQEELRERRKERQGEQRRKR